MLISHGRNAKNTTLFSYIILIKFYYNISIYSYLTKNTHKILFINVMRLRRRKEVHVHYLMLMENPICMYKIYIFFLYILHNHHLYIHFHTLFSTIFKPFQTQTLSFIVGPTSIQRLTISKPFNNNVDKNTRKVKKKNQ